MKFEKWQACGNDFIITEEEVRRQEAKQLCDRHYGIGADGVLEVLASERADCKMVVVNADGSIAEMCGNGIRCVGQYVSEKLGKAEVKVETGAGIKVVRIVKASERIEVEMGEAKKEWKREIELPEGVKSQRKRKYSNATFVNIGNPHCVLLVNEEETKQGTVERFGRIIEHLPLFPEGANVEFVTVQEGGLRVKVWERGSGRTLACGTGACASAYAAYLQGLVGERVKVELDGGEVEIEIEGARVKLKGPAERVYRGEV